MGRIDLWECSSCHALTTYPMPDEQTLNKVYSSLDTGYPDHKSTAKLNSLQYVWYEDLLNVFSAHNLQNERIAEIGAGEGFLVASLIKRMGANSSIHCYDLHDPPKIINDLQKYSNRVHWIKTDITSSGHTLSMQTKFDRIFLISVIEHVRNPRGLITKTCDMLGDKGRLHVVGPCINSVAKIMGKRWPYLIPAEHLTIPSIQSLKFMCQRIGLKADINPIRITYSFKYLFGALSGISLPSRFDFTMRLPLGGFAMTLTK
jgi:hypothetical protein